MDNEKLTEFLMYTSAEGNVKIDVYIQDETIWLPQKKIAQLFDVGVSAVSKHLKNIKLIKLDKNMGPSFARNIGWNLANGNYIAFLDSDDFWHPQKLEIMSHVITNNPDSALLGHGFTLNPNDFSGPINAITINPCFTGKRSFKYYSKILLQLPVLQSKKTFLFASMKNFAMQKIMNYG